MCAAKVHPAVPHTDIRLDRVYWLGMTISNVLCMICCCYNGAMVDFGLKQSIQKYVKALFVAITTVLCYMRQDFTMKNYYTSQERYATAVIPQNKWIQDDHAAWLLVGTASAFLMTLLFFMFKGPNISQGKKKH